MYLIKSQWKHENKTTPKMKKKKADDDREEIIAVKLSLA